MATTRDLSGNNPVDRKYTSPNRTVADMTALLATTPQYPGEIIRVLETGNWFRALGALWGVVGPQTDIVAGTPPAPDTTAPTVTINKASGQADPTAATPVMFTVTFSESVTGFNTGDVSFAGSSTGGTLVGVVSGGPAVYDVTVTGMAGPGNVVASVPAAVAVDLAGNPNEASTSTDNSVSYTADLTNPTVTINKKVGQDDPTDTSPILFTVTFSESVTGFTDADVSFGGSTVGGTLVASVSGSGADYEVSVSGMTTDGDVIASIPVGVAVDGAGNPNEASTSSDNIVTWAVVVEPPGGMTMDFSDPANSAYIVLISEDF